jgi:hypothetical protein
MLKLLTFAIVTFVAFSMQGYLICLALQSEIRALICGAFLARTLVNQGHTGIARK